MNEELVSGRENIRLVSARIFAGDVRRMIISETRDFVVSVHRTPERLDLHTTVALARTPIAVGEQWGQAWDSGYFFLEGTVPDGWSGRDIACQLDFGGEGLVYDRSGEPLVGLSAGSLFDADGTFKKDIVVVPAGASGDRITMYVEAAGNALLGVRLDDASYVDLPSDVSGSWSAELSCARYGLFNASAYQLAIDVDYLLNLYPAVPVTSPLRDRILLALFDAGNRFYDGNLEGARGVLRAVHENAYPGECLTASVVGHAHIDTAWLWPIAETRRKVTRTFVNQLDLLNRYGDFVFGASSAQHYDWIRKSFPAMFGQIQRYVAEGRWEIQGAMWVEPDANLVSAESLVRQIKEGQDFWRAHFGIEARTCWIPDVFGYPVTLPQILQGADIPYFLTQKMSWSQFNMFPHNSFVWKGRDGSEVLAHFPPENTYNSMARPADLIDAATKYRNRAEANDFMVLAGIGDGGGGPTDEHIERVLRSRDTRYVPRTHFRRADLFFDDLNSVKDKLPRWYGELYLEYHRGTYTSHGMVKKNNRRTEEAIRALETLATFLPPDQKRKDIIRDVVRDMLTMQFHDILPGSSIHQVYLDALETYRNIRSTVDACASEMMAALAPDTTRTKPLSRDTLDDRVYVTLYNALSQSVRGVFDIANLGLFPDLAGPESVFGAPVWDEPVVGRLDPALVRRIVRIVDPSGNSVPFDLLDRPDGIIRLLVSIDIEPWTLSALCLELSQEAICHASWEEDTAPELILENNHARYCFDRNGSFVDHMDDDRSRRGNELRMYHDRPHAFEAWDIDFTYSQQPAGIPRPLKVYRLNRCETVEGLRFVLSYGDSTITQDIFLSHESPALSFESFVDWKERRKLFRTSFPVDLQATTADCDVTWGTVGRNTQVNTDWDFAQFEFPARAFVSVRSGSRGISLLNDCKYGYSCRDGRLGLSLLRSTANPDPVADLGEHRFTYVYLPYGGADGAEEVRRTSENLNRPPAVFLSGRNENLGWETCSSGGALPVRVEGPGVVVFSLRWADEGSALIVRFGETTGIQSTATISSRPGINAEIGPIRSVDLVGRNDDDIEMSAPVTIPLEPFQIRTFRVGLLEE